MEERDLPAVEEGSVVVVPYDADWPEVYECEASRLRDALGDLVVDCQHIGSTAVPGSLAKPIVDILLGVRRVPPDAERIAALAGLDYVYLGQDGRRPSRFFFRYRRDNSYNLSVVPYGGPVWRDNLALRDYLRSHPVAVQEYSETKRRAAATHPDSLLQYQDAKRDVVEDLKRAAVRMLG